LIVTNPRTTIFGALAAAGAAIAALPSMPQSVHVAAVAVSACAVALLGFFAKDADRTKTIVPIHKLAVISICAVPVVTACTVGKLGFNVANPTFGSLDLSIGGGTIGNANLSEITTSNRTTLREVSHGTTATTTNRNQTPTATAK
jgi:phosphomevalonate kinase